MLNLKKYPLFAEMEKWALQKNKLVDFKPRDLPSAPPAEEPNASVRPTLLQKQFCKSAQVARFFVY